MIHAASATVGLDRGEAEEAVKEPSRGCPSEDVAGVSQISGCYDPRPPVEELSEKAEFLLDCGRNGSQPSSYLSSRKEPVLWHLKLI